MKLRTKERGGKKDNSDGDISVYRNTCCQHMFAWLYIKTVINRSIIQSLTDSCHFNRIRL